MMFLTNKKDSGFVLVNALVLVAAMAAIATFLLSKAEQGRNRLAASQTADQLVLYLDSFEALATTSLSNDRLNGAIDSFADEWANANYALNVDRGEIAGAITDMQSLFNLNWLLVSGNDQAQDALKRLLLSISVSPKTGDSIIEFIQPGGPNQIDGYLRQFPPIRPTGGALVMFDQLSQIPNITVTELEKLRSYVTVLPNLTAININTVSREVLASLLPDLSLARINTLIAARRAAPFETVEAFTQQIELWLGTSLDEIWPADRWTVGSEWFQVDVNASLDGQFAVRRAALFRQALPAGITTEWRLSYFP
ncbi:MAG: type II secretion system minor pseudopilin GspK [Vibrio splendidus]